MQEKKSIRSWIGKNHDVKKFNRLVRRAARIVKRLELGEVIGGRTGTLLTPDEWSQVKITLYGVDN